MQYVALLLLVSALSLSQPVFAQTWSDPVGTPPLNNASTPLNVSATSQAKAGGIAASSFLSTGSIAAQGNIGVGMSTAPDAFGVLSSGTYGDAYGKWSSLGHALSAFPLSLSATDYGYGTVWDGSGAFFGLTNSGVNTKDTVIGWGSSVPNPTDLIYKYNGGEVARLTSAGNLGLGVSAPGAKIDVDAKVGSVGTGLKLSNSLTNGTAGRGSQILYTGTGGGNLAAIRGVTETATNNTGFIDFQTSSVGTLSSKMVIGSNGNVGVGTTTPASKLTVAGTIQSTTGGVKFPDGTTQTTAAVSGGGGTVSSIIAGTGLTGGTITASGTIAADTAYLQRRVSGTCTAGNAVQTIAADGTVTCQSVGGAEADTLATVTTRGNTTTNGVSVGSLVNTGGSYFAGNVGVGTTTPPSALTVVGTGYFPTGIGVGNNVIGHNSAKFEVYNNGNNSNLQFTGPYHASTGSTIISQDAASAMAPLEIVGSTTTMGMNGNVGIGVMNPTAKLEIVDGGNATVRIGTTDNRTNANLQVKNAMHVWANNATSYAEVGAVDVNEYNNGSSPTFAGIYNRYYGTTAAGTVSGIVNAPTAAGASVLIGQNSSSLNLGVNGANPINFFNSGGTKMTVLPSGNVGIGTTAPLSALHVGDGVNASAMTGTGLIRTTSANFSTGFSARRDGYAEVGMRSNGATGEIGTYTVHPLVFVSNGTDVGRITTSGNFGIGTSTPAQKLSVVGTIESSSGGFKFPDGTTQTTASAGGGTLQTVTTAGNTTTNGISIASLINNGGSYFAGNVGIGTSTPTGLLSVGGNTASAAQVAVLGGAGTAMEIQSGPASASNILNLRDNTGTAVAVVKNTGNVGLGTTAPNQKLSINGGIGFANTNDADKKLYSSADGDLEWFTNSAASVHGFAVSNQGTKQVYLNTSGNSYLNGGNVGIGTTAPGAALEIQRPVNTSTALKLWQAGIGSGFLGFKANDSKLYLVNSYSDGLITNPAALVLDTAGNVGIGTASPSQKLDVNGNINVAGGNIYGINGVNGIGNVTTGWYSDSGNIAARFPGTGDLYVQNSGGATTYARIGQAAGGLHLYTGNGIFDNSVGIGTAAPSEKLDISGGGMRVGSGNFTQNVNHGNYHVVQLPAANNGAATGDAGLYTWVSEPGATWTGAGIARNMRNSSGAFPRINTGLSSQMIRFDEGSNIVFVTETAAGVRTQPFWTDANAANATNVVGTTGTFSSIAANTFTYASDRNLKKNITPLESSLDKIQKLQGVSFNWKTDADKAEKKIGFIAQEVEKIFPEVVSGDKIKGVEYGNLVAPLVEAVKEQQGIIDAQKTKIDSLEARLERLEAKLK